ncbi:MAG: hypothetical protein Q9227_003541 [Pyrenula ochraceoflavens]
MNNAIPGDNIEYDTRPERGGISNSNVDVEKADLTEKPAELSQMPSHLSHHDLQPTVSQHVEANAAQYTRFSSHRKIIITITLSLASFLAPMSSTSILSAIPEVASEYDSTGSIVNLSNALYMLFMGISPCVWGPLSQVYGRRSVGLCNFGKNSLLKMADMSDLLYSVYGILHWDCARTQSGFLPPLDGSCQALSLDLHLDRFLEESLSHLKAVASSSLVFNMYSLLTPIRYVLNPRFHLTSPIQSGLFYIAPGCGYLLGTMGGGRWADHHVKKWIRKKGKRVPEDRLRSCVSSLGAVIPGCMLVYGWTVEKAVGGVPVPVIAMFFQGVAQLFCFPSLNTYCVDVMQSKGRSAEVVASNYMARYFFGAAGSAVVLPAVEAIGVGWFSTISAAFLVFGAGLLVLTILFGESWRDRVDEKKRAKKTAKEESQYQAQTNEKC